MTRLPPHSGIAALLLCALAALCRGGPAWHLEPVRVALGRFPANRPPSAVIFLVNDGATPMEGFRLRTGCGCLAVTAEASGAIPPGGRRAIQIALAPERLSGPFSHSLFVEADDILRRVSVTGEAVPLFRIHPAPAVNLGDIACGAPFRAEIRLSATMPAALGAPLTTQMQAVINRRSPESFCIILHGNAPASPGHFRFSVSIPVASPTGWKPLELAVFGKVTALARSLTSSP